MNSRLAQNLRTQHEAQAGRIRRSAAYGRVSREFGIEYQVAQELAKARRMAGMTQKEVAAAMRTTQSVISRIESGTNVSIETLDRYVAACGHHLQIQVV